MNESLVLFCMYLTVMFPNIFTENIKYMHILYTFCIYAMLRHMAYIH